MNKVEKYLILEKYKNEKCKNCLHKKDHNCSFDRLGSRVITNIYVEAEKYYKKHGLTHVRLDYYLTDNEHYLTDDGFRKYRKIIEGKDCPYYSVFDSIRKK